MLPLLLLPFFVVCQAEPRTEYFIVELQQNKMLSNQSFSINPVLRTLSFSSPKIADTSDNKELGSPPEFKQHKTYSYGVKETLVESISWPSLYAIHLLVRYELIRSTMDAPLRSNPYSWLSVEVILTVGWLLKSYWNFDSMSFKPKEQPRAATMVIQRGQPFAYITVVPGSGHSQQPHKPSEPSRQQAAGVQSDLTGSFTKSLDTDSADNNGGSQQTLHTLSLNCFVFPCHGVCSFRPSSNSREPAEWPPDSEESSTGNYGYSISVDAISTNDPAEPANCHMTMRRNQPANSDEWIIVHGLLNLGNHSLSEETGISNTPVYFTNPMVIPSPGSLPSGGATYCQQPLSDHTGKIHRGQQQTCDVIIVGEEAQPRPCAKVCKNAVALSVHKSSYHTGQKICNVTLIGENGQPRPCGRVFKNAKSLSGHKSRKHVRQRQTCHMTLVMKDGELRPCGKVFPNTKALWKHKNNVHNGKQICDVTLVGKDGRQQPCRKVFENAKGLSDHKRKIHSGEKLCDVTVVGEDAQPRSCGTVCKNAKGFSDHKKKVHSRQQTCHITVIGQDGQRRPCGKACKNEQALSSHKTRDHTGQKTCDVIVVGEDDQLRSCGMVCKNAQTLSEHKSRNHTGQKTCDVIVVGEDGQPRQCGMICKNAKSFSDHKRKVHSGQQTCVLTLVGEDGLQRPCAKVFRNAQALSSHKCKEHSEQKTCNVTVIGEDDQPRPCRIVCKNTQTLSVHKSRCHSGQQTCVVNVTGKDGQLRPCGRICISARALYEHKRRNHSGPKTCDLIVTGEDGQPQPCRMVCKNVRVLSYHKKSHRKRKSVDPEHDDGRNPKQGKQNK
ncbi:hypothetical protein [Endozoicomonas sp. ISHI1]|uniref:hypothetical protein n=1 Tax=Endozoicomonas sp. ISHI1 TaxID=2825882 RepID=UPI002148E9D8|nr:hypothetical protein [Endozoicomonas sp. ISHI1]